MNHALQFVENKDEMQSRYCVLGYKFAHFNMVITLNEMFLFLRVTVRSEEESEQSMYKRMYLFLHCNSGALIHLTN